VTLTRPLKPINGAKSGYCAAANPHSAVKLLKMVAIEQFLSHPLAVAVSSSRTDRRSRAST
jgi:hypothetical protein